MKNANLLKSPLGIRNPYPVPDHHLKLITSCLVDVRYTSWVDVQLNSTMRLISGTLRSTPLPWLPVLSNIEPPALRRKAATDKLVEKIFKHDSWPIHT